MRGSKHVCLYMRMHCARRLRRCEMDPEVLAAIVWLRAPSSRSYSSIGAVGGGGAALARCEARRRSGGIGDV